MTMYSVEQVAEHLGLHVRTVRGYVRDGKLKAVRIGKQYRISREDLEAFTGRPVPEREPVRRHRHAEVTSIVSIDAVDREAMDRVNTYLTALARSRGDDQPLRVETAYDEERATMKIIILGGLETSATLLGQIGTLIEAGP
ncbi:excisionase family DNA binding protein [Thermocatellispora tengchongensis]|uniref:Excisionase family DNA binding protein n=1 Tax=Thermocatellispora tengchongensis TaxID=1073253 RepID=A0A840NVY1_9ACTN|nr:helix-turn-helix domain-containing protein [Thermocatellispora tengchongensis]MBB5130336.1 excisionase family DNA binding protein [Thermocatellispora tengchongensis]